MDDKIDLVARTLAMYEEELFVGSYSENTIRADLQNRKAMDMYSTMGSSGWQTNEVEQKKRMYLENFTKDIQIIDTALDYLQPSHEYVSRLIRCKKQVDKLRDIVRDF